MFSLLKPFSLKPGFVRLLLVPFTAKTECPRGESMFKTLKYPFVVLLVAFAVYPCSAQQMQPEQFIKPISPVTPNAASLGIYGDVPVSVYTGIPNIQIPIYNIEVGGQSFPISLSYHSGGVKVEDYSSWVGTGWSLNAGGVINRQQRADPDENMIDNYSQNKAIFDQILDSNVTASVKQALANNFVASRPKQGLESDIFSYNAGDISGKFFMDPYGNPYCIPSNKLKIQQNGRISLPQSFLGSAFQSWTITDNNGIKYVFGSNSALSVSAQEVTYTSPADIYAVNSWYLTEIITPGKDTVTFNYQAYTYSTPLTLSSSEYIYPCQQTFTNPSILTYKTALRLSNIVFPNGKVEFVAGGNRQDLPGDQVLNSINIYSAQPNNSYTLLKTYKLYTNNPSNIPAGNPPDQTFRLRLDSVTMFTSDAKRIGAYTMTYNNFGLLPARTSYAQDMWGFYNGQNNTSLVPIYYVYNPDGTLNATYGNANRAADPVYSQYGVLSQLTYPTGGYSLFQFESNKASVMDSRLINLVNSTPTSTSVAKMFTYELENLTGQSMQGTSAPFTVGTVVPSSIWSFQAHVLSYGGSNICANVPSPGGPNLYYNPCFSATLIGTQTDGTVVNMPIQYFNNGSVYNAYLVYPGTYQLIIKWNNIAPSSGMAYVTAGWNEQQTGTIITGSEILVGGLRIKSIANYDPVTNATYTKNYQYTYTNSTRSSGTVESIPVFNYPVNFDWVGGAICNNLFCIASQSQSPLITTQGSIIGYANVIETLDNNGAIGQNVYSYTSDDDFLNDPSLYQDGGLAASEQFPFPSTCSNDWKRGLLTQKTVFANVGGTLNQAAATSNTYTFSGLSDINYMMVPNIKFNLVSTGIFNGPPAIITYGGIYSIYYTSTGSVNNNTKIEQVFDNVSYTNNVSKVTTQVLDPQTLESSSTSLQISNGKTVIKTFKYPLDYNITTATDNATLGINNLISANKVKAPVEILEISQDASGTQTVTGGMIMIYYKDKPEVQEILDLAVLQPIPIASFTASSVNTSGNFVYDSRYQPRLSADAYTPNLQLAQETKIPNKTDCYQWGYNNQYPVAKVTNAPVNDIFFDSFEEGDGNTASGNVKTGHYSFSGNYSHQLQGLDPGQYTLSYWQYGNNTWTLINTQVTVPSSGSYTIVISSGQIDDVRFYPSNSQMTTYTYDPLIGMTSVTDPKSEITFYEYDSFQRLMNIKDKDGNIVKHLDYHYQVQR